MRRFSSLDYLGFGLAAALLLCLLPMPYGYYVFVRFVTAVVMMIFGIYYLVNKQTGIAIAAFVIALLFQPFFKIALGRVMWNILDVVLAILLIALPFLNTNHNK